MRKITRPSAKQIRDDGCFASVFCSCPGVFASSRDVGRRESCLAATIDRPPPFGQTDETAEPRPHLLDLALPVMEAMAVKPVNAATSHRGQMAPRGVHAVLAMAVTRQEGRTADD